MIDLKKVRAARLKEEFEKTGWSKSEFARKVGMSPGNVNNYLEGLHEMENIAWSLLKAGFDLNCIMEGHRGGYISAVEEARTTPPETKLEGTHIGRSPSVQEPAGQYITQTEFKSLENLMFIAKYNLENAVQAFTDAESELEKLKVKV